MTRNKPEIIIKFPQRGRAESVEPLKGSTPPTVSTHTRMDIVGSVKPFKGFTDFSAIFPAGDSAIQLCIPQNMRYSPYLRRFPPPDASIRQPPSRPPTRTNK